jgi:3-oxoacyl-[acyl-carrier-protein] synthase-3
MEAIKLTGFAAAVPETKVLMKQLPFPSNKHKDQFTRQVGITEKRFSNNLLTAGDLCFSAAQKMLHELSWDASSVGVLILVTQSPDQQMPATAIRLQEKLGLPRSCLAFDINLGCSGWVCGLSVVSSLM